MIIHKIPEQLETIIFDMDGTLYTSPEYVKHQDEVQIKQYAIENHLDEEATIKEFKIFRENWFKETGKKISLANTFREHGVDVETVFRWRDQLSDPEKYLHENRELREALISLKDKYKLTVVTNNSGIAAKRTLEAVGIADLFSCIISLDISKVSKPARRPFELAAENAGSTFSHCLSIGDRYDIDLSLPLEMGMGAIEVKGAEDICTLPALL